MRPKTEGSQGLLKRALIGNAMFSGLSGAAILLANRWLVKFLGLPDTVSLAILGVSLIVYAAVLWFNARRPKIRITDAWVAVVMDAVWVLAQVRHGILGFSDLWPPGRRKYIVSSRRVQKT